MYRLFFQWFREEVSREADLEGETAVGLIELLADAHGPCLQEMESRLARWESNARHNIGDFLYNTLLNVLPLYDQYLENLIPVLEKMEYSIRTSRRFDQLCRDFESQKHCYLPLSSFLLKPLQRLLHYNSIIDSKFKNDWTEEFVHFFFGFNWIFFFLHSWRASGSLSKGSHRFWRLSCGQGQARWDSSRRPHSFESSGK